MSRARRAGRVSRAAEPGGRGLLGAGQTRRLPGLSAGKGEPHRARGRAGGQRDALVGAEHDGPNAQPFSAFRHLSWLTPVAPSGAPVTGAGTPVHVFPASPVRASEVQYPVAQRPGELAWPSTHPVPVPVNVTELGRKSGGTAAGTDAAGDSRAEDDSLRAPGRGRRDRRVPGHPAVTADCLTGSPAAPVRPSANGHE